MWGPGKRGQPVLVYLLVKAALRSASSTGLGGSGLEQAQAILATIPAHLPSCKL